MTTSDDYTHCMRILISTNLGEIAESSPYMLAAIHENIANRCIHQPMPDGSTVKLLWYKLVLTPVQHAMMGDLWTKTDLTDDVLYEATKLAIEEIAQTVIPQWSTWQVVFHISKPLINSISN